MNKIGALALLTFSVWAVSSLLGWFQSFETSSAQYHPNNLCHRGASSSSAEGSPLLEKYADDSELLKEICDVNDPTVTFDKFILVITDGQPVAAAKELLSEFSDHSTVYEVHADGVLYSHAIYSSWLLGSQPSANLAGNTIEGDNLFESLVRSGYRDTAFIGSPWPFLQVVGDAHFPDYFKAGVFLKEPEDATTMNPHPVFFEDIRADHRDFTLTDSFAYMKESEVPATAKISSRTPDGFAGVSYSVDHPASVPEFPDGNEAPAGVQFLRGVREAFDESWVNQQPDTVDDRFDKIMNTTFEADLSLICYSTMFDRMAHSVVRDQQGNEKDPRIKGMEKRVTKTLRRLKGWVDENPEYLLILSSDHGIDRIDPSQGYVIHGYTRDGNEGYMAVYNPRMKGNGHVPIDVVDIASTLSTHLNSLDVPSGSHGYTHAVFPTDTKEGLEAEVAALRRNALQLAALGEARSVPAGITSDLTILAETSIKGLSMEALKDRSTALKDSLEDVKGRLYIVKSVPILMITVFVTVLLVTGLGYAGDVAIAIFRILGQTSPTSNNNPWRSAGWISVLGVCCGLFSFVGTGLMFVWWRWRPIFRSIVVPPVMVFVVGVALITTITQMAISLHSSEMSNSLNRRVSSLVSVVARSVSVEIVFLGLYLLMRTLVAIDEKDPFLAVSKSTLAIMEYCALAVVLWEAFGALSVTEGSPMGSISEQGVMAVVSGVQKSPFLAASVLTPVVAIPLYEASNSSPSSFWLLDFHPAALAVYLSLPLLAGRGVFQWKTTATNSGTAVGGPSMYTAVGLFSCLYLLNGAGPSGGRAGLLAIVWHLCQVQVPAAELANALQATAAEPKVNELPPCPGEVPLWRSVAQERTQNGAVVRLLAAGYAFAFVVLTHSLYGGELLSLNVNPVAGRVGLISDDAIPILNGLFMISHLVGHYLLITFGLYVVRVSTTSSLTSKSVSSTPTATAHTLKPLPSTAIQNATYGLLSFLYGDEVLRILLTACGAGGVGAIITRLVWTEAHLKEEAMVTEICYLVCLGVYSISDILGWLMDTYMVRRSCNSPQNHVHGGSSLFLPRRARDL